jgi:hypothetical protein
VEGRVDWGVPPGFGDAIQLRYKRGHVTRNVVIGSTLRLN